MSDYILPIGIFVFFAVMALMTWTLFNPDHARVIGHALIVIAVGFAAFAIATGLQR